MSGRQRPTPAARCRSRREGGQATPSVVAVVSVVAIVVAMVAFFAGAGGDEVAGQAQDEAAAGPATTPSPRPSGQPSAARTPEAEKSAGPAGQKRRDGRPPRKKRDRQPRPQPDTGPPDVYVEVYNNTAVSGLAASTSAELQDAGWQVVGVDNWYGDIPASTVYYPSGLETEAEELAEVLGIDRVRGAVAPMKFDRLTVILTPDAA